jgi:hypothetical protein
MALQVQVHIKLPKFAGVTLEPTRAALDDIAKAWLEYKPLPRGVKVWALQWRDGSRKPWSKKETRAAKIEAARENFSRIGGWSGTASLG